MKAKTTWRKGNGQKGKAMEEREHLRSRWHSAKCRIGSTRRDLGGKNEGGAGSKFKQRGKKIVDIASKLEMYLLVLGEEAFRPTSLAFFFDQPHGRLVLDLQANEMIICNVSFICFM